jgi:hypothetical protein
MIQPGSAAVSVRSQVHFCIVLLTHTEVSSQPIAPPQIVSITALEKKMRTRLPFTLFILIFLISPVSDSYAQQPKNKTSTPRLTTEDIGQPNSSTGSDRLSELKPGSAVSGKLARFSPAGLGLSVELPGEPAALDVSFPEDGRRYFNSSKACLYYDDRLSVFINRFSTKKSAMTLNELRSFAAGFLDGLSKKSGWSDAQNHLKERDDSTLQFTSTHKEADRQIEMRGFVHARGSDMWLVFAKFAQIDEGMDPVTFRIINSVKID